MSTITKKQAYELLKKYNEEPFHLTHGLTVSCVMEYFARELGFEEEQEFWGLVGLLHDVDFERWPEEHCQKAPALLAEINAPESLIHGVVSHGYGLCSDVAPEHTMEKVLYAVDELTGLIGAYALMRPDKSVVGMKKKSLKKKFKDKKFAAGCDREVITRGAELLEWDLDELMEKTIEAMVHCEGRLDEYTA